jgi:hypothetical protein
MPQLILHQITKEAKAGVWRTTWIIGGFFGEDCDEYSHAMMDF